MSILSRWFRFGKSPSEETPEQAVTVHFHYGSTNLQYVYALEDLLRSAITEAAVGEYDRYEVDEDGSHGSFHMYGPNAEALHRVISPLLTKFSFTRGGTVTLWAGPPKWGTAKRVIRIPE